MRSLGRHIWRSLALYPLVMDPLVNDILVLFIPILECTCETILVHLRHVVDQSEQRAETSKSGFRVR